MTEVDGGSDEVGLHLQEADAVVLEADMDTDQRLFRCVVKTTNAPFQVQHDDQSIPLLPRFTRATPPDIPQTRKQPLAHPLSPPACTHQLRRHIPPLVIRHFPTDGIRIMRPEKRHVAVAPTAQLCVAVTCRRAARWRCACEAERGEEEEEWKGGEMHGGGGGKTREETRGTKA